MAKLPPEVESKRAVLGEFTKSLPIDSHQLARLSSLIASYVAAVATHERQQKAEAVERERRIAKSAAEASSLLSQLFRGPL